MNVYVVRNGDGEERGEVVGVFSGRYDAEQLAELLHGESRVDAHPLDAMKNMVEKTVYLLVKDKTRERKWICVGWVPDGELIVEWMNLDNSQRIASTVSHEHARMMLAASIDTEVTDFDHWLMKKVLDTPN